MTQLVDEHARQRFRSELDRNFCVAAGAGAGKTTAIVDRIAALAAHEPDTLPQLVVVTYARAAADELRQRAREKILVNRELPVSARNRQLAGLRQAFFGTIHSFCLKLVRNHGRWLGLPDALELLEPHQIGECWARFLEHPAFRQINFPPELMDGFLRHETVQTLLNIALALDPGVAETALETADPGAIPPPDAAAIEAALAVASRRSKDLPEYQDQIRQWMRESGDGAQFLPLPAPDKGGREFLGAVQAAFAGMRHWLSQAGLHLAARISLAFRDFRTDQRLVSYDDMVYWSRRLIDHPATLEAIRRRGLRVILDEAQDTDFQMFAVLTEITRPATSTTHAWPDDPAAPGPEPGRFSFVGDEQQAIYGSRASLSDYARYIDAFAARHSGEKLEFTVTMRCPRRVIDLVNALFADRTPEAADPVRFRRLDPRPDAANGAFQTIPFPRPPDEPGNVDDQFQWECGVVADFLADRGLRGLGIRSWGEVAVLCARNKWMDPAARIFRDRGLPARLLASRLVARESPARSWPTALFHVLANPSDRFELIGVLHEIFGVSDLDLADAQAGEGGLHFHAGLQQMSQLRQCLDVLWRLHARVPAATGATLSGFVVEALREIRMDERLHATGALQPGESADWCVLSAAAAECAGLSFREWAGSLVERIDTMVALPARSTPEIQLLSCHKSKGLQWPVIVPLGFGRPIRDRSPSYPAITVRSGKPSVLLSKEQADEDAKEQKKRASAEELLRLWYVTLTRAMHCVLLPDPGGFYKSGSGTSFREICGWAAVEKKPAESDAIPGFHSGAGVPPEAPHVPVIDPALREQAAACSQEIPARILPHALAKDDRFPAERPTEEFDEPVGGIDYGLWWHETFEAIPWQAGRKACETHLAASLDALASQPETRGRAAAEIALFLKSMPCEELLAQANVWLAEVPFSHPMSSAQWVEGVIDLVVLTRDGGVWIVDWKTNRPARGEKPGDFRSHLAEVYAPQIAAYAAAIETATGRRAGKLRLYATALGEWIDLP